MQLIIKEILREFEELTGNVFQEDQLSIVESRVLNRVNELKLKNLEQYYDYFRNHKDKEISKLVSLLTTHYTFFFREFVHFEYLTNTYIPSILNLLNQKNRKTLRIWSAACSTGEEPYSLAFHLSHCLKFQQTGLDYEILASDVDLNSLRLAKEGCFFWDKVKTLPKIILEKFFDGNGQNYCVRNSIKSKIQWQQINLIDLKSVNFPHKFDIIFLRNVLIYFNPDNIIKVLNDLAPWLEDHGILVTGISENINDYLKRGWKSVGPSIYQKNNNLNILSQANKSNATHEKIRILIVDDSVIIQNLMKKALSVFPEFEVIKAVSNGKQAWEFLAANPKSVDVITLDMHMPEMNGLEFIKKFGAKSIPIIIVSSVDRNNPQDLGFQAMQLGAADYIEKPTHENLDMFATELGVKVKLAYEKFYLSQAYSLGKKSNSENSKITQTDFKKFQALNSKKESNQNQSVIQNKSSMEQIANKLSMKMGSQQKIIPVKSQNVFQAQKSSPSNPFQTPTWRKPISSIDRKKNLPTQLKRNSIVSNLKSDFNRSFLYNSMKVELPKSAGGSKYLFNQSDRNMGVQRYQEKLPWEGKFFDRNKIKVFVVDDSPTILRLLNHVLSLDSRFVIVGEEGDPNRALKLILHPNFPADLIILDINMPGMDGVTLLKNYIQKKPISTVILSSLSLKESHLVLEALQAGAVDFVQKPAQSEMKGEMVKNFLERLYVAAKATKKSIKPELANLSRHFNSTDIGNLDVSRVLVVMGASTGGTEAVKSILQNLGSFIPPILVAQHIPPIFSQAYVERLRHELPYEVFEGVDGLEIKPNRVIVAPGGRHMRVAWRAQKPVVEIVEDFSRPFTPSVDLLFESVAEQCHLWDTVVAVILTGMGDDGARAMALLKAKGAFTIAQDEVTSVVYGMPRAAVALNAVVKQAPIHEIPRVIWGWIQSVLIKKTG